jgi:uncharacterized tellurite resistance protein B-like protein
MRDEHLILTLAKVVLAAAWADGELSYEEINSMKDVLFRLPQLSARQWASLQMYIEAPVGEAERARLVDELRSAIASKEDRELAMQMVDEMMRADGQVTEEDERVAAEIRAAVESVDVGRLGRLFKGATSRRSRAVAEAPNREDYYEDFVKNKVYYGLRRRLDLGEAELGVGEEVLRTLSLAGGMMAQVARVNPDVGDAERATMAQALQTYWHLGPDEAAFVVEVALSESATLLDPFRLAWQFSEASTPQQRVAFLDVLFAVATADGKASFDEIEEIRTIAGSLKLSHEDFIQAKLKVPPDRRGQ